MRVDGKRANYRPGEDDCHECGVQNVWPPTHPMMTEHATQNELHVEHEDGKQTQRDQAGAARVEIGVRLFLNPAAAGKHRDGDRDTEERLCDRGVRSRNPGWLE